MAHHPTVSASSTLIKQVHLPSSTRGTVGNRVLLRTSAKRRKAHTLGLLDRHGHLALSWHHA